MLALVTAGLSLATPITHGRFMSNTPIGKYPPSTDVQDHANIDLDQAAMESAIGSLDTAAVAAVKAVYLDGAFSKPYFECTIANPTATVAEGDKITYTDSTDTVRTTASAKSSLTSGTSGTFKVNYPKPYSDYTTPTITAIRAKESGTLSLTAAGTTIGTCTTGTLVNKGGRTLKSFSTKTWDYMINPSVCPGTSCKCPARVTARAYMNGCPYTSAQPYYTYYCGTSKTTSGSCSAQGDYANQYVLAALDLTATDFDNFNINFGAAPANEPTLRKDFIKKTTAYSSAWMYAIREFEDAIDDCTLGDLASNSMSSGPVHAWDEGVAFYVGSLLTYDMFYDPVSGQEVAPPDKKLAYTLANKRCKNFKTCSRTGDKSSGEAYINFELWKAFSDGQDALLTGNCAGLVPMKNKIVQLMTVPLVQGTLRYSWYCRNGATCSAKAVGELAAFAVAIAPQVHACNPAAATTLSTAANPNSYSCVSATQCSSTTNDFAAVKAALESCYPAMGLTCTMIGGLWSTENLAYEDAITMPCSDTPAAPEASDGLTTGGIIGIAVGAGFAVLLLLFVCYLISNEKSGSPLFTPITGGAKPSA